jgi:general secretion pathway protein D
MSLRLCSAVGFMLVLSACVGIDPRKPDSDPPGMGILGSGRGPVSSGRPATMPLPPISREGDGRDRPSYVEIGTGQYVDLQSRKQVEFDEGGQNVSLNFVDVELQEFVRVVFDEVLKENVILDAGLKGRITLRTSNAVSRATALDLIRQALHANGASLMQSGSTFRVGARSDQKGGRRLGESVRIIPLTYIGADEAKSALAPFGQSGVDITPGPNGRYVAISGSPNDLDNLEQVLATLDVDQMKGMSIGLFPLREAGALGVANELTQMFGKANDPRGFRSLPITRMNAVLIISPQSNILAESRKWIARLDRADRDGRRIYVYPVQNRRAVEISRILAGILNLGKANQSDPQNRPVAPQFSPISATTAPKSSGGRPGSFSIPIAPVPETDPADLTSKIEPDGKAQGPRVDADPSTNSVVVIATAEEWNIVESALRRLDVMPPQVLIEATIAEVTLNDNLRHGIRWYLKQGNHSFSLTDSNTGSISSVFPGFNYSFGIPEAHVVLNALEQITDVQVVSSPALTVLDNQTARLQVGDQVPVATRASQSVVNPDAPLVNDIEFKDTGIILMVTPRVNASGLVLLDISQEVSDVVPTTTSTLNSPTIRQRRVNSSVAVRSGREIVLGGLISISRSRSNSGFPGLMEIPIVGNLFKSQATLGGARTELLVILRPTVMGNSLDIQSVTNEIKARMSGVRGALYR